MLLTPSVPISVRMLHASDRTEPTKTGANDKGNALAHVTGRDRGRAGLRFDWTQ